MLLYVIRHGDPIYSPDSLTEREKLQAQALAKRLSVHGLDRIFSSPLNRARQTAEPTCELLKIEPQILNWTSEALAWDDFSFRFKDGKSAWAFRFQSTEYKTEEILAKGDRWYEAYPFCETNAKEGWARVKNESDNFLMSLGYKREGLKYRIIKPSEERVAVFCHQGFGTVWLSHLLSIIPPLFWASFDISHSSVTILNFKNNENGFTAPQCLTLSDTSHIYAEHLPMMYNNVIPI